MTQPTLMLAAWFVNPALLGGLALVALPVLIHLLSRRRFELIEWGAMRFLLEAERENRRRVRFEQLLLVMLRCAAMLLLVMLVARPFVRPGLAASLLGGRGQVKRIVVIDDSASLRFTSGNVSDFATVRESANRLLGWLNDGAAGEPITVYVTSAPTMPLADEPALSAAVLADLTNRIGKLAPTYQPATPRRVFAAIAEQLAADSGVARADVYVLSDFQRSDWVSGERQRSLQNGGAGLRARRLPALAGTEARRLPALAGTEARPTDHVDAHPLIPIAGAEGEEGGSVFEPLVALGGDAVRLVLISAGAATRDNVAVTDVCPQRPRTIAGMPCLLDVTVANFTASVLRGVNIQAEISGAVAPPVAVDEIAPGESRTVAVEAAFPDEGRFELAIRVGAADGLPADDTRGLAMSVKRSLEVLLVDGAPATEPASDEVYFARSALAPAGPFSSGVSVSVIDPSDVETAALDTYDCVMLCNVPPAGPGAVGALSRYVRAGGGLVFTLGDQVGDPDVFNRAFRDGAATLLPLPLKGLRVRSGAGEAVGVVRVGEHPITAMFPGGDETLSEYVRFRAYYECGEDDNDAPASVPNAVVAARFTDKAHSPALIERAFGRGRVLLFTSTIDLDWNDWTRATDGSYVVALLEMVQHMSRRDDARLAFVVGDSLAVNLSPDKYEPAGLFRFPAAADRPAVAGAARQAAADVGESLVVDGPVADLPGTYSVELKRRDGSAESRPLCVNFDARESDLAAARRSELDAALGGLPREYISAAEAFPVDGESTRYELWPTILTALVVLLMVEQLLAWWFGNPMHGRRGNARRAAGRTFARGAR